MKETVAGFKSEPQDRRGEDLVTIANRIRKDNPNWSAKQVISQAKVDWQTLWNDRNKK